MVGLSTLLAEAREGLPRTIALRRRIHAHPELGLDLPQTAQSVRDALQGLDVEIAEGPSSSGLVATLKGAKPGRTILLRGDMDALPMPEDTGLAYASEVPGRMHACGHDAHTAMLAEAVHLLHRRRGELAGTVKFMFQPGEEGYGGAKLMLEDGLIDQGGKPDAAFALHINPTAKAGTVAGRKGTLLASADSWMIKIIGQGGHAAWPQFAVDPVPVACEIVQALHVMTTRRVAPFEPVVLTCGKIQAGTTDNVIPETAEILGTARATSESVRETVLAGIERIAVNIAAAHLCRAEVTIERGYPVTVNDPGFVDFARGVAADLLGGENYHDWPHPVMGAEDFSYVLQEIPGCMLFLGVRPDGLGDDDPVAPIHSNRMTLNENAMADGVALHAAIACRFLSSHAGI